MKLHYACTLAALLASILLPSTAHATIDHDQARSIFEQANVICSRDNGAVWGLTLCGPMILVDPGDRAAVANQADSQGLLTRDRDVFSGALPKPLPISDTTITWTGVRWCELMWPWPMREDDDMRHVTLAHELFHRIQADLHFDTLEGDNRHLDTLEGRYLIEMEWRALAAALKAKTPIERNRAITDAILFRSQRYQLFAAAAENEGRLEANEGIAEYTGVRIGLSTSDQRTAYALRDLTSQFEAPSLVRSFAYATGPAYGLLLDQVEPNWRISLLRNHSPQRFDQRLSAALMLPEPDSATIKARMAVYDADGSLRAKEVARDDDRHAKAAQYKATLIDGPVLILPLKQYSYEFKPQSLVALPDLGTVYPTMTLHDEWGTLTVDSGGVLIEDNAHIATISATGFEQKTLHAPGFQLELRAGWAIVPGKRSGDLLLSRTH